MTAFATAAADLFADDNLSVAGTYTPAGGGPPVAVRVVLRQHDPVIDLGTTRVRAPGWTIRLSAAEVPMRPTKGASIADGVQTYSVRDVQGDGLGLTWDCDVDTVT